MKQITTLKEFIEVCNYNVIEFNLAKRWEKGTPHHPKSIVLVHSLSAIDTLCSSNCFDWRTGGDGDNGETLMYELDLIFELENVGYTVTKDAWK